MSRRPLACLALLAALLAGCAGRDYRPGAKPVSAHWPGKGTGYDLVPYPGEYVLLRTGESAPVEKRELPPDVPVGFELLPDGRLLALAGKEAIPLEEGDYRWHLGRVSHGQRARLALARYVGIAEPYLNAALLIGGVVLLAGALMLVLSWIPPGVVHI